MKCFIFVGGSQSNQSGIETVKTSFLYRAAIALNRTKAELKQL